VSDQHSTEQADDTRLRYAAERAQRQLTLAAIRADLQAQPSARSVLAAGRHWCADITAMADAVAQALRKAA
jgi:ATP:corrinoid adenosyltransferase